MPSPVPGRTPPVRPSTVMMARRISPPTSPTPTQKLHLNTHRACSATRCRLFFLPFFLLSFFFSLCFSLCFYLYFRFFFVCFCFCLLCSYFFILFCYYFFCFLNSVFFVILFMCYANIRRMLPYVRRNRWPTRGRILQQHAGFCILNDVKISVRFCAGKQRMEVKKYGKFKQKKKGSAASVI